MSQVRGQPRGAAQLHAAVFGAGSVRTWSAPGRVNLIGEHTDYNDGLCLPFAVEFRADCAVRQTSSGRLRIASAQRPGELLDVPIDALAPGSALDWAAYIAGAVFLHPCRAPGLEVLVDSDVPEGAGLSSSAALVCATLAALGTPRSSIPALAQRVENEFIGVPCGIMDQTASTLCRQGCALLIDVAAGTATDVKLALGDEVQLLVLDTGAPHRLVDGEYALRREECASAARLLDVPTLRQARTSGGLPQPERGRARHVLSENSRGEQAVALMRQGDVRSIGPLLTMSHFSLRDDFQVSVPQLDVAVEAALGAGAHGARMTGGGFGGSIIALVDDAQLVSQAMEEAFAEQGWPEPRWFVAEPAEGLRCLTK